MKGRLTAFGSVVLLVALTAGSAGLSLATSAPSYTSPAATLQQAVDATLASSSFTIHVTSTAHGYRRSTETFVYAAPDRSYELYDTNLTPLEGGPCKGLEITIVTTSYGEISASDKWSTMVTGQDQPTDTPSWNAGTWLRALIAGTTVRASGDICRSFTAPYMFQQGLLVETDKQVATTVIQDGRVMSSDIVTIAVDPKHPNGRTVVVARVIVTYSAFGTSPSVTAPPANDTSG